MHRQTFQWRRLTKYCIMHCSQVRAFQVKMTDPSFSFLLLSGGSICRCNDIQSMSDIRQEESACLSLHLLNSWVRFHNVHSRIRNSAQTHYCRPKSIHPSVNLRFRYRLHCLHFSTNELFQQSPRSILHHPVFTPHPVLIFI